MLSRSSVFGKNAPRALHKKNIVASRRAASSFQFTPSETIGVKVASREVAGPTGALALVAKAGTRYQPLPGFSDALEQFAFKVGGSI